MNFPFFVAKRYYFSKHSKSIINIITWIAVIGLAVSTAAMTIVLSAFNGIESMVHELYSDFDPEITIESKKGKTINYNFIPVEAIEKVSGVKQTSRVIEEIVIIKHENKWVNAQIYGIDSNFFETIHIDKHIAQGSFEGNLNANEAIVGIGLLYKLDGIIFTGNPERVLVYAPSRDAKIMRSKNPFRSDHFLLTTAVNYNREVNAQTLIVSFDEASKLLNYDNDITRLAIELQEGSKIEKVQKELREVVGDDFIVKTHLEKNELIYKTSRVEKIIVFFILVFIFILATFNMVASLTMLFIDKKQNLETLSALGLAQKEIFKIFFFQGLLITFSGIVIGLIIGYSALSIQYFGEVIILPNSGGDAFPVVLYFSDTMMILAITFSVGIVSSWLPVRFLVKKFGKELNRH